MLGRASAAIVNAVQFGTKGPPGRGAEGALVAMGHADSHAAEESLMAVKTPKVESISTMEAIVRSPWLNVIAGLILVITGLLETLDLALDGFSTVFGAHHGIATFGVIHVLKSFPDVFKGLKFVEEGEEAAGVVAGAGS